MLREDTEEWVRTEAELGACNARWEVDMAAMHEARRDQKEKAGPEALQLLTTYPTFERRALLKIASHIDKKQRKAKAEGRPVPEYPSNRVAAANMYADHGAEVAANLATVPDVLWPAAAGQGFGYTHGRA